MANSARGGSRGPTPGVGDPPLSTLTPVLAPGYRTIPRPPVADESPVGWMESPIGRMESPIGNINLDNHDLSEARRRIRQYMEAFGHDGTRITRNLDFDAAVGPAGD